MGKMKEIFMMLDMNQCPSCEYELEDSLCTNCETDWEEL